MTKVNSRAKGARGEREWAKFCKEHGYDCRRGQQYCGANGDADVVGLPGIYLEVKRYKTITHSQLNGWLEQAFVDSKNTKDIVVLAHREDNCKWFVTMDITNMIDLCGADNSKFVDNIVGEYDVNGKSAFYPVTMLASDWFEIYKMLELERVVAR